LFRNSSKSTPAPVLRLSEAERHRSEARCEQQEAGDVEPRRGTLVTRLLGRGADENEPRDDDRDVDPEDETPVELGEGATRDRPKRERERTHRRPDAHRPAPVVAGECVGYEGQREREQEGRAGAHHGARCDHHLRLLSEAPEGCTQAEQDQAAEERPPAAD
jgi:hypothetical protein